MAREEKRELKLRTELRDMMDAQEKKLRVGKYAPEYQALLQKQTELAARDPPVKKSIAEIEAEEKIALDA